MVMRDQAIGFHSRPAVSICMPVYNGRRFLSAAFASLSAQTCKNFEIIVVDDGSTDDSGTIAQELMKRYGFNGKVLKITNRGCEQARDLACEHSTAGIIAPFDCDDEWIPTYLDEMLAVLNTHEEIGLVYCDFLHVYPDHTDPVPKSASTSWIDLSLANRENNVYCFKRAEFFELLLQGQVLFPPCTMFRKELYTQAGMYAVDLPNLRISLDWSFGLRASRLAAVAFLHRPLLLKTSHDANTSGNSVKTAVSDVSVLVHILDDRSLSARERTFARKRAAARAIDAAYGLWWEKRRREARQWLFKSLGFGWSSRAAKLALLMLMPANATSALRGFKRLITSSKS